MIRMSSRGRARLSAIEPDVLRVIGEITNDPTEDNDVSRYENAISYLAQVLAGSWYSDMNNADRVRFQSFIDKHQPYLHSQLHRFLRELHEQDLRELFDGSGSATKRRRTENVKEDVEV
jgi:hypothetical protein